MRVEYLFAIGAGFEIAGGVHLARGLIRVSPAEAIARSQAYYGWNPIALGDICRARANAIAGLAGLGVGFVAQVVGYMLALGTGWTSTDQRADGWFAGLIAVATAAVAFAVLWPLAEYRTRSMLRGVRSVVADNAAASASVSLAELGGAAGVKRREHESDDVYVARVFGPAAVRQAIDMH